MADGWGFWCTGACARKKNEQKKEQEDAINAALASLNQDGFSVTQLALGGLLVTGVVLFTVYKIRNKK